MNKTKTPNCQNEFGQYESVWGGHGKNCKHIIRITKDYIVFIDRLNNIDWETSEECDKSRTVADKGLNEKTLSQCLIAEHKPTGGLSEASIISFKTIIGEAIVNCLENNCVGAVEILREAEEFRVDRVVEKSREWYLSFTVVISFALIVVAISIQICPPDFAKNFLQNISVGAWAMAGACLSIILRSGRLHHASYAGKKLHFIESGCRVIGGAISGQIAYLGIKSGILFTTLITQENSQYVLALLALLAGASERFAPSIITKIEDSAVISEIKKEDNK